MAQDGEKLSVSAIASGIQEEGLRWKAAQTPLAQMPAQEQRKRLGLLVTEQELMQSAAEVERQAEEELKAFQLGIRFGAPAAVDWRNVNGVNYVTSVKDQGSCGSCVSFCTCAVMEANMRIKSQDPNLDIDLSEAFLQFCGGGSCNGWGLTSGLECAQSMGVADDACFPYQPQELNCNNRCSDWESRVVKINSYTGHASMQARKDAIANIGPVLAGMAVYNDFFAYSSGIYQKISTASLAGYHCISVVGYDDNQQCWILKNSWGNSWGENGYARVAYSQSDLLIDSSWQFYSVDPNVQPTKGSGQAQHLMVDKVFGGSVVLWAYAGGQWRYKYVADADLKGISQVLFTANRVDVWWDQNQITLIRPWKTFS